MYSPATLDPEVLLSIGNGDKYQKLRSVIFCTEDAVRDDQVPLAMEHLREMLPRLNDSEHPMRFIRVRSPHILGECLSLPGIIKIDGFVLPKVTAANIDLYTSQLIGKDRFSLMPTLETAEVFDAAEMIRLRTMMQDERVRDRILCLRIGGNDLMHCLRIRRDPRFTIYETAIGSVISQLSGIFIPYGFGLTAPVCEVISGHDKVLREEVRQDLRYGLFGKTAIHPDQIELIEAEYCVDKEDLSEAQRILRKDASAVFRAGQRMCEPATHSRWAQDIITRAEIYGLPGGEKAQPFLRAVQS
jgi:citrate lyase beta subunit